MGRFALAAAEDGVAMAQLWNAQREEIEIWAKHPTQVLPAAVCMLVAARHVPSAKDRLPAVVRRLIENCYAIEAAYALPDLPAGQQLPMRKDIITIVNRWKRAIDSLPPEMGRIAGPLNGPGAIVELIRDSSLRKDTRLRAACYPMTLVVAVSVTVIKLLFRRV